jgi:fructosamine-3-kinase
MFVAEAKGLLEIAATQTITVPSPICWGTASRVGIAHKPLLI